MKEIKGVGGSTVAIELEIDDIEVGNQYKGNLQIYPKFLQGEVLTITSKNANTVTAHCNERPSEIVQIYPFMLEAI